MHKIHEKEFTRDDFSIEHLNASDEIIGLDGYIDGITCSELFDTTIAMLNYYRKCFIEDGKNKDDWWQMIQLLPSSYNQMRTVKLNYEVLARMYKARKHHKLDEWREFCKWIEQLPYAELITGEVTNDANSVCVGGKEMRSLNGNHPFWEINPNYKAILEVDKILTEENIPHELLRLMDGYKIAYPTQDNCIFDVIEHRGSYGHENDMMEAMGYSIENNDVIGYLDVEGVLNYFRTIHKELGGETYEYMKEKKDGQHEN